MFEQIFKNIDDRLHKDAGSSSELDYVEQSSWILFLKYLSDLERDKENEAALQGKEYEHILSPEYRWEIWAYPLDKNGKLDHQKVLTGDDLIDFINLKLFPYLKSLKSKAIAPDTIEYKIGEVFSELRNKIQSGYTLRDVLDEVDKLKFRSSKDKHELSHLYESKIKNMGNAGRNGGEYYTPRPLIRAMVKVIDPRIGETVYDGAVGSAGFLCEAFEYMKSKELTAKDLNILQTKTFYGRELKSLAYIIGIMNMILHGIEAPNILHANTLAQNINDIQEKDRYDIILTNPPFGAGIRSEIQQNFPIKTGETAFLFLQHFIKSLKAGGRGAVVIKNTFLSNTDNASISLRKYLIEACDLKMILDMPKGTFTGAVVKTVVLFFEKGKPTKNIWYYQLNPGRNMGKTSPLNDQDMAEFLDLQKTQSESLNSWNININSINPKTLDLSVRNPNNNIQAIHRTPQAIIDEISELDSEIEKNRLSIKALYDNYSHADFVTNNPKVALVDVCEKITQGPNPKYDKNGIDKYRVLKTKNLYDNEIFYDDADRISEEVFNSCFKSELQNGDVLLAIVGQGSINKCNVFNNNTDTKFIFTRALGLLRTKKSQLDPYYLRAYLQSQEGKKLIDSGIGGTSGQQIVTTTHLKALKIPLPSIEDQRRVVRELDSFSKEIGKLNSLHNRALTELGSLKESLMYKAFANDKLPEDAI